MHFPRRLSLHRYRRSHMSIEALAMAGVDPAKCSIKWQDFRTGSEPPPPHLLEEEEASNSAVDTWDCRWRMTSGIVEDQQMKMKMLGWAKHVASTHKMHSSSKGKRVGLDKDFCLS
ncbi:hypothetical protein BT93_I0345 [Corymbia citriodora subsp. variegata]|nr:hypothetical protein BT93_I0345 [Corymbia citriodora subsp. variegata]